jgi:hypothetical protein
MAAAMQHAHPARGPLACMKPRILERLDAPNAILLTGALTSEARMARGWIAPAVLALCASGSLTLSQGWLTTRASDELAKPRPVLAAERDYVVSSCRRLARSIDRRRYYLVVTGRNDPLAYGCFPLNGLYVTQTMYDRRTWFSETVGDRRAHEIPPR